MQLNSKAYDFLKWVVQILLPSLGTFYFTVSQIFDLPYGEEVIGTLAALALFIGALIGISKSNFDKDPSNFDGSVTLAPDPNGDKAIFLTGLNEDNMSEWDGRKSIVLQVKHSNKPLAQPVDTYFGDEDFTEPPQ